MTQLFANNAYSVLASAALSTDTTLALATGTGSRFPAPSGGDFFEATLIGYDTNGNENAWEVVKCTGRSGDTLTVVRAIDGSTAVAWASAARIEMRAAAGLFGRLASRSPANLSCLLFPSVSGFHRDLLRAGFRPSWFNQQWGGAQWGCEQVDGATGKTYKFDVATGSVQDDAFGYIADNSTETFQSQSFKVSDAVSLQAFWLKAYKVGNPVDNFTLSIYSDSAGAPNAVISNGAATAVAGKSLTSKADGEWVRFNFATPPTLSANTAYHAVITRSGALDASNYYAVKVTTNSKYPNGFRRYGGTAATATANPNIAMCFMAEPDASTQFLRSGGQFDSKLVMQEGSPLNQSKSLAANLKSINFDGDSFTALFRVQSPVKGKPIADFVYGADHDRLQVMCNSTTGYPSVNLYQSDRTLSTVTGTADVSGGAFVDIAVAARMRGDGADYLKLFVNGVPVGTPLTAQTFTVSKLLRDLGALWVGGGFPLAPAWTQDLQMTALPSTNGWSFQTPGITEANAASIQNNRLVLDTAAMTGTDYAYWQKTTTFSNATGWSVEAELQVKSSTKSINVVGAGIWIHDGTKRVVLSVHETFLQIGTNGSFEFLLQGDFKSSRHTFRVDGKGSDFYLYVDGYLAVDGTGKMTDAVATNQIYFGDTSAVSGETAEQVWSSLKYSQAGMLNAQAASGMALHEAAIWSGDQTGVLPALYNSGTPIAVKQYAGVSQNYVREVDLDVTVSGVTNSPTTTSTSPVLAPELELFALGDKFQVDSFVPIRQNAVDLVFAAVHCDGVPPPNNSGINLATLGAANDYRSLYPSIVVRRQFGMHKLETKAWAGAATATHYSTTRTMTVRNVK